MHKVCQIHAHVKYFKTYCFQVVFQICGIIKHQLLSTDLGSNCCLSVWVTVSFCVSGWSGYLLLVISCYLPLLLGAGQLLDGGWGDSEY